MRRRITMFAGGGVTHTSGGVGTLVLYLMDAWAAKPAGPQVRMIDTRGSGGKVGMALHFAKAVALLVWLGATRRLGVMHIHMNANGSALRKAILSELGHLFGAPVILHLHGADFREFYFGLPAFGQNALRFVLNRAAHVIVLGRSWRDFLVSDVGVHARTISVVLNGVPQVADTERAPRGSDEAVHIVFLGRLGARKGVPDLLAAFQTPEMRSRCWTATIAGDGPVDQFREAVGAAGLEDRVSVPGWVDRATTLGLLRRSDIFVLPSHHEAMPMAILEALAHGAAVVATPVGAIPEFLTDGQTALLVPAGDSAKLAEALVRLIDDPEERQRLGSAGQRVFRDSLDIGVVADRLARLYDSVASSAAAPGGVIRGSPASNS